MNGLEQIQAVQRLYRRMQITRNSYERWKALAENTTGTISEIKVQTNDIENKMDLRLVEMITAKDAYERATQEYIDALNTANSIIFSIENPEEMELVYRRYIDGATWQEISCEMGISERKCYMLNQKVCAYLEKC